MRFRDAVFVDTGAWIALALSRDPLHERARSAWDQITRQGGRVYSSVPVVLETFTFLDRQAARDVALAWRESLDAVSGLKILPCAASDLREAWAYFTRFDLHKLSGVDATSFVLMKRRRIRAAFAFDHHFATVGFRMVG